MAYTLNDAISRANERCQRDNDGYCVYEDNETSELIVQTYAARKPPNSVKVYECWPNEQRLNWPF